MSHHNPVSAVATSWLTGIGRAYLEDDTETFLELLRNPPTYAAPQLLAITVPIWLDHVLADDGPHCNLTQGRWDDEHQEDDQ